MHNLTKFFRGLANLLFGLILALGIALILLRLSGFKLLAVYTGSMGESCPVGSLVIADNCAPKDISAGDIISFVANEKLTVVTHRVLSVDYENRKIYTKGDANNTADSTPVSFDNLIGKVKFVIPKLGCVVIWADTTGGKAVIALSLSLVAVCIAGKGIYCSDRKRRKRED